MMKNLLIMLCLLPVLASAQSTNKTFNLNDGALYLKQKTNLRGTLALESGYAVPVFRSGNIVFSANVAYVQDFSSPWKKNNWESGVTANYRLSRDWSVYTKTLTNFTGSWSQETGVKKNLYRTKNYTVSANVGNVFGHPFRNKAKNSWTFGVTVSFPVKTLFK